LAHERNEYQGIQSTNTPFKEPERCVYHHVALINSKKVWTTPNYWMEAVKAEGVIQAYMSLSPSEKSQFWARMEEHRQRYLFSSSPSSRRLLTMPEVPQEVVDRMKEVIPYQEFEGDVQETVR
jgi:hypothetical protein